MADRIERGEVLLVAEHDRRERGPVDPAVGASNLLAEAANHLLHRSAARRDHLTAETVHIHRHRTTLCEQLRHGRLADADSTSETHDEHERNVGRFPADGCTPAFVRNMSRN